MILLTESELIYILRRRLILIRHGVTEWNKSFRFQGRTDIQLTDEGIHQAHLLSQRLTSWPPDVIYTSPLKRAKLTASITASQFSLNPVILQELTEINFGDWEGKSLLSLEHDEPDAYSHWRSDPFFNPPIHAETWPEISSRLTSAIDFILSQPHERIMLVTHGGIIRALLAVIMGFNPHKTWYIDVGNCSLTGIEYKNGHAYMRFMNDCHHITSPEAGKLLPLWGDE